MLNEKNSDCQFSRPYRLENTIQHYDWGTRNHDAYITELLGINPEPGQAYAELWMGVHPNAPSSIIDLEEGPLSLSKWISESPQERLSTEGKQSTLPYLFKVLSAGEALSIQLTQTSFRLKIYTNSIRSTILIVITSQKLPLLLIIWMRSLALSLIRNLLRCWKLALSLNHF